MTKSQSLACAGILVAAAVAASPAKAEPVVCGNYQPGMLEYLSRAMGVHTAPPCFAYRGDYMVKQGPVYDGPAVIAPQPTYAPSPGVAGYAYVHGKYGAEPEPAVKLDRTPAHRVKRAVKKTVVLKNDLPPPRKGGKAQIVHARAEVRIYSPERMEIRLYRR